MCIAQTIKYKFDLTEIESMFQACLKVKSQFVKKHIVKKNIRTQYDAFIFKDDSRLTFKLTDNDRDLIVWNYYKTNRSYRNV